MTYVIDLDAIGESALERDTVEACLSKIVDHTKSLKDIPGALRAVSGELEALAPGSPEPTPPAAREPN